MDACNKARDDVNRRDMKLTRSCVRGNKTRRRNPLWEFADAGPLCFPVSGISVPQLRAILVNLRVVTATVSMLQPAYEKRSAFTGNGNGGSKIEKRINRSCNASFSNGRPLRI